MANIDRTKFTAGQQKALEMMLEGKNVFLTGEAGTGKSEVVKFFIKTAEERGDNILITAPTGTAADNLHGETIHRCFGADIGVQKNNRTLTERKDVLRAADIIIIDEISMCRFDLFEYVARRILFENQERNRDRVFGFNSDDKHEIKEKDLQLIVLGDFYQLPPIITKDDRKELDAVYKFDYGNGYAFQAPSWKLMNFEGIILTEIVRQDDKEFKDILTEIRKGNKNSKNACIDFLMKNSSDFPMTGDDSVFLIPINQKCKDTNDREMAKLNTPEKAYYSSAEGEVTSSDKFAEDEIVLKEGCKVMLTVNEKTGKYVNGTMGIVQDMGNEEIEVLTENGDTVTIRKHTKEITKPVVKTSTVKKLVSETVLDSEGNPKTDEDGNVIKHDVMREVIEETISHEKVGSFTQFPIRVAYAITIHKSQGKTFNNINLDPYAWDYGQFYTALSRGKKIENICFMQTVQPKFIKTSPEVKEFMKKIEKQASGSLDFEV